MEINKMGEVKAALETDTYIAEKFKTKHFY